MSEGRKKDVLLYGMDARKFLKDGDVVCINGYCGRRGPARRLRRLSWARGQRAPRAKCRLVLHRDGHVHDVHARYLHVRT